MLQTQTKLPINIKSHVQWTGISPEDEHLAGDGVGVGVGDEAGAGQATVHNSLHYAGHGCPCHAPACSATFSIPITIPRDEVNRCALLCALEAAGSQVTPQLVQKRANNCTRYLVGAAERDGG